MLSPRALLFLIVLLLPFSYALEGFSSPQASVSLDDSLTVSDSVVYSSGFVSDDGQNWEPFSFSGTSRGDWIIGEASSSVRTDANYYAIYSCSWNPRWDCSSNWQVYDTTTQSVLVQSGQPRADIVVSADAPNMVQLAAEYFQNDIEAMSGATLPIRNTPGNDYDFHVYIGQSQYTDDLGITDEGTEYDGYKIISGNNYLVMLGDDKPYDLDGEMTEAEWDSLVAPNTWLYTLPERKGYHRDIHIHEQDGRGSMNAVHAFLYDQGMRWYYPTEYGTITPNRNSVSFSSYNTLKNPDFKLRNLILYFKDFGLIDNPGVYPDDHKYGGGDEWLRWVLSVGKNSDQKIIYGSKAHGIDTILEDPQTQADHPEYYAVYNGQVMNGEDNFKPDFCSEGLKEEAIAYASLLIEEFDTEYINLWPTDGFTSASSRTQECKNQEDPERGNDGKLSNHVWNFMNDVAWEINDEYGSEHKILSGAYGMYKLPPTRITNPRGVAPNLAAMLVMSRVDFASPQQAQLRQQAIDDWQEFTPGELFLNDKFLKNWQTRKTTNSIPYLNMRTIAQDFQRNQDKSNGGKHETATTSNRHEEGWDAFAATAPNVYIKAKAYWDADLDVDGILDEYFTLYYGPAEDSMRSLYEYSEDNIPDLTKNPVHLIQMRAFAQQAISEVPQGSPYERRIQDMLNLMNANFDGAEIEVSSCQMLDSHGSTYLLTKDISTQGTCFFVDHQGITLDCQGHTIESNDEYIVEVAARQSNRGHYFTMKNCVIKNRETGGRGLAQAHGDFAQIHNNRFEMKGSGIGLWIRNSYNTTVHDNVISSETGRALYSQHGDTDDIINTIYTNNVISSVSGQAAVMYGPSGDIYRDNTFYSQQDHAIRMTDPINVQLIDNTIESGSTNALSVSNRQNLVEEGNTIIDG